VPGDCSFGNRGNTNPPAPSVTVPDIDMGPKTGDLAWTSGASPSRLIVRGVPDAWVLADEGMGATTASGGHWKRETIRAGRSQRPVSGDLAAIRPAAAKKGVSPTSFALSPNSGNWRTAGSTRLARLP
jgi:hypothetical protein